MLLWVLSSLGKRDARSRLFARPWENCFMACLLARGHLPPSERASAYGVVVHLEERQGEGPVSPHEDRVGEFKKEPDGAHGMRNEINSSKEARKRPPTKLRGKKAEASAINRQSSIY